MVYEYAMWIMSLSLYIMRNVRMGDELRAIRMRRSLCNRISLEFIVGGGRGHYSPIPKFRGTGATQLGLNPTGIRSKSNEIAVTSVVPTSATIRPNSDWITAGIRQRSGRTRSPAESWPNSDADRTAAGFRPDHGRNMMNSRWFQLLNAHDYCTFPFIVHSRTQIASSILRK